MTTPNDNTTPSPEQHNSLMDNLREPFQAWVAAGSRLGDVVSDFADRFREDRDKADHGQGAHAKPSPVEGEETTASRFKAAAQEARAGLSDAKSTEDYKTVSAAFAGHAEEIIRDLAASARRAAEQTKDSPVADDAKNAFNRAVASVRATFDETVDQARTRRAETGDEQREQSFIDELRGRLDDLISRAGSLSGQDVKEGAAPTTPTAPSTNGDGDVPHMIDGEVISTTEVPADTQKDS
ncbi:CGLAU_01105 family protein [Corynebacterium marinum]|uniref:Uncharacterized protein n=1 Tax=Corynebacterium marinum DSM 44953 TaxID=1224162 RepID=A0A0B6TNV0_9CORY|nr:CGLAU_01105 family protein [Corynebacterium marinum]AJK67914.1 hypothetical protein B840_01410 [Corynebacterium marinum DSM 44953]GGO11674.1 hypothetical protein GCM10010980_03330 [Corynebacterium marinum]